MEGSIQRRDVWDWALLIPAVGVVIIFILTTGRGHEEEPPLSAFEICRPSLDAAIRNVADARKADEVELKVKPYSTAPSTRSRLLRLRAPRTPSARNKPLDIPRANPV